MTAETTSTEVINIFKRNFSNYQDAVLEFVTESEDSKNVHPVQMEESPHVVGCFTVKTRKALKDGQKTNTGGGSGNTIVRPAASDARSDDDDHLHDNRLGTWFAIVINPDLQRFGQAVFWKEGEPSGKMFYQDWMACVLASMVEIHIKDGVVTMTFFGRPHLDQRNRDQDSLIAMDYEIVGVFLGSVQHAPESSEKQVEYFNRVTCVYRDPKTFRA